MMIYGPGSTGEACLFYPLLPLAWLYGSVGLVRSELYRIGFMRSLRFEVPIVSVGNLAVGGTGKTPMVDYIAKHYLSKGKRVAVVSRGYGGRGAGDLGVVSDGQNIHLSADVSGDEPRLLAERNPGLIVVVAPRRSQGVRAAIDRFGAEVVVLDDGFQHLAVQRDLDVVLLDAKRPLGNGQVLPAGLLREFSRALRRADLFVLTRSADGTDPTLTLPGPFLTSRHELGDRVVSLSGQTQDLAFFQSQRVAAFAGVANPESFFADLRAKGLHLVTTLPFPDHVAYRPAEMAKIVAACSNIDSLLTTEKDAIKLTEAHFPVPCYSVPLEIFFDDRSLLINHLDRVLTVEGPMAVKQELLDILACPKCKGEIRLRDDQSALICDRCQLAYPIRENIPVMLIDEAIKIGEE